MAANTTQSPTVLATNRRARHDFAILERLEAGIELRGTEVKSLRAAKASLTGSFAQVENNEVWLHHCTIQPYDHGNRFNHDPERVRRLLLHRKQIDRLRAETEQKGLTLVPLGLYLKQGRVKIELGLCKGKTHGDKRETLRRQTAEREASRAMGREG